MLASALATGSAARSTESALKKYLSKLSGSEPGCFRLGFDLVFELSPDAVPRHAFEECVATGDLVEPGKDALRDGGAGFAYRNVEVGTALI